MKESKAEKIRNLRRQGKGYDEIAKSLKKSLSTAHKYGRGIKAKKTAEKTEVLSKELMKANTRAFMWTLIRETAMFTGHGKKSKKGKLRYVVEDEDDLKLQNCETVVKKSKAFILLDLLGILRYCLKLWKNSAFGLKKCHDELFNELQTSVEKLDDLKMTVAELREENEELRAERKELKKRVDDDAVEYKEQRNRLTSSYEKKLKKITDELEQVKQREEARQREQEEKSERAQESVWRAEM